VTSSSSDFIKTLITFYLVVDTSTRVSTHDVLSCYCENTSVAVRCLLLYSVVIYYRNNQTGLPYNNALLPPTTEEVNAFAHDVCLSVSKISQKRMHGFR